MSRRRSKIATEGVAEATRPARRRRGRFAKLVFLGGIVAFVTNPQVRGKALDVVFGPEEQFDYESVTEPVVRDIQSEDAETAWPGAATAPPPDDGQDDAPAWRLTTTPLTGDAEPEEFADAEDEETPASAPWSVSGPSEPQAESPGEDDGPTWRFAASDEPPSAEPQPDSDPEPETLEATPPPSSPPWPPADTAATPEPPPPPSSEPGSDAQAAPESEPPAAPWSSGSTAGEPPAEPEEPSASGEGHGEGAASHPPADAAREVPEHAWGVPASESPGVTHTPVPPADEPPTSAYRRPLAETPPGEATRPAIGEATPPRSGWWLPRRRREDSEPTQWDWRSE